MNDGFQKYGQPRAAKSRFLTTRGGAGAAPAHAANASYSSGHSGGAVHRDLTGSASQYPGFPLASANAPATPYHRWEPSSRRERVEAAIKDGTFNQKRETYNKAATNTYMDGFGNIHEKPAEKTHGIYPSGGGDAVLTSKYGTGSVSYGPRKEPFTIGGKPAQDWFSDEAKKQGRANAYAKADGTPLTQPGPANGTDGAGKQPSMIEGKPAQEWFSAEAKKQGRANAYANADGTPRSSAGTSAPPNLEGLGAVRSIPPALGTPQQIADLERRSNGGGTGTLVHAPGNAPAGALASNSQTPQPAPASSAPVSPAGANVAQQTSPDKKLKKPGNAGRPLGG
jgi:hypothetical protein